MTWSPLHAHLHQTLRSRLCSTPNAEVTHLLPTHQSLLVAVSGGQDSQCLLRLLVDLQTQWQWSLHAIHCNHRWRADADANARFVTHITQDWGVTCTVIVADTPPVGEAAARQWRYGAFEAVARQQHCTHVVTGHTASDRAETLLYNLIRGSGSDGLQALGWHRPLSATAADVFLIRPLLDVTRAQTQQFCQDFNLPIWEDTTNEDPTFARNRMRQDILPRLRAAFNPQTDAVLAQTAELLAAEVDYLATQTTAILADCLVDGRLHRQSLRSVHLALQRRVIRQVLMQQFAFTPQFDHVEKVVALLWAPNRSQSDPFPGGAIAIVNDPWIQWERPA